MLVVLCPDSSSYYCLYHSIKLSQLCTNRQIHLGNIKQSHEQPYMHFVYTAGKLEDCFHYSLIQIRKLSKHLLLQLATQDSLARLKSSKLGSDSAVLEKIFQVYFQKQHHTSIVGFLKHYLKRENLEKECTVQDEGALLQVRQGCMPVAVFSIGTTFSVL